MSSVRSVDGARMRAKRALEDMKTLPLEAVVNRIPDAATPMIGGAAVGTPERLIDELSAMASAT